MKIGTYYIDILQISRQDSIKLKEFLTSRSMQQFVSSSWRFSFSFEHKVNHAGRILATVKYLKIRFMKKSMYT